MPYNKEYQKAVDKRFKERNPNYHRDWNRNHPEVVKLRNQRYFVIPYKNAREEVFHILGHVCKRCGEYDKRCLEFDHVNGLDGLKREPLYKSYKIWMANPEWTKANIQVLCANCNRKKSYEKDTLRSRIKGS